MNDPKHFCCLESVKVGDILCITVSHDKCMANRFANSKVEEFPVTDIYEDSRGKKFFIVISHYNGNQISACGTLVKIKKKR